MSIRKHTHEYGALSGYMISTIALIVVLLVVGSFAIWAYVNYDDQKSNVDAKVDIAVAEARRAQAEEDEKKFAEREKQPYRAFVGPEDYGRLAFEYPKTWSAYIENDASRGGTYEAYLHRDIIPPISNDQQFMLRILIEEKGYDEILKTYESRVKKGELRSSTASFNGETGTRLDGNFTKDIRGAAVIFKVRDKTVTLRTDADQFKPDFEALISTISFNN